MAGNRWAADRATFFYLSLGVVALAAVGAGFFLTYARPMARGDFHAPPVVHLHGAAALAWVLLFLVQAGLVRGGRTRSHRRLGWIGLPLALLVLGSGVATGLWATARDLTALGDAAYGGLTGTVTSLTLFCLLVGAAVRLRRRPDWHKRLMLLATILVLWPAWFRFRHFLPFVPRPEWLLGLVLADLPILLAAIRDRIRYGAVHPAWKWVGSALVIEQCTELMLFGSPAWNAAGKAMVAALT